MRRTLALVAVTLAAAVFGLLTAAAGQGGLTASNPTAQAALPAAPAAVLLTFSAVPSLKDSHVSVLGDSGETVNAGKLALAADGTLRQPVSIDARGDFTVAYHVKFETGGEAAGTLRFSVGTGVPPPASDRAIEAATASVNPHGHGIDSVSAAFLVVNGLVVLGVVALLYLRRPVQLPPD